MYFFRLDCTIYEYGLVTIVLKLKYMSSVLPFHQEVTINQALLDEVNLCVFPWYVINFLIDSKKRIYFLQNLKNK